MGSTSVRSSARKSDTGTLSNDAMNARNAPAPIPRPISGSVMRRNVVSRVAPRLVDASSSAWSSCASAGDGRSQHERHAHDDVADDQERDRRMKAEQVDVDQCGESERERGEDQRRHEEHVANACPARAGCARSRARPPCRARRKRSSSRRRRSGCSRPPPASGPRRSAPCTSAANSPAAESAATRMR